MWDREDSSKGGGGGRLHVAPKVDSEIRKREEENGMRRRNTESVTKTAARNEKKTERKANK